MQSTKGGCACGAVRYEFTGAPAMMGHCHCRACQRDSGTGHASHLAMSAETFKLTGPIKYWDFRADSGNIVSRGFCTECGSPISSKNSGMQTLAFVRAASLDDPAIFKPQMVVWTSMAHAWASNDSSLPTFDTVPQFTLAPVHLNRIVEQVVELTRVRWSNEPQARGIVIDLATELAPDLPAIMGVEGEIRDALTNLVFNVVDAMPEGGTLTLRTRVTARPQTYESVAVNEVSLEVSDSGAGMDEATRRHCLEPFFTTKGERGTGLGLAMVYGMVQRHSAELLIESTLGIGTTARLVFAAALTAAAIIDPPSALRQPLRPLHILIVDDDPLIIESLRDILQCDGHQVAAADGGQAGIDAFMAAQKRGAGLDAVITDLGMPYIDGRRVAMAIKAVSPATPIILLTGWGQRLIADNDVPAHVDRVLNKPPKLDQLRNTLCELVAHALPESLS